jgi:hypothetical protein
MVGALKIEDGVLFDNDRFGFMFPRYWRDV